MENINKLKVFVVAFVILISTTLISVYILRDSKSASILKSFNIKYIKNTYKSFTVEYEKVPAAKYYKIEILDNGNTRNKIYTMETKNTKEEFELENLENGVEYSLMVYAYDARGDYRPANNEKLFTWDEITFIDTDILLHDEDKILSINGEIDNKGYKYKILENDNILGEYDVKDRDITISKDLFINKEVIITVQLLIDNVVIDDIKLYSNINPITDAQIMMPLNNSIIPYGDFTITYKGLDNVDNRIINIYDENNRLLKAASMKGNTAILSKELFVANKTYRLEVVGSLEETYSKSTSITITTSDQEYAKPVYINKNPKYVKEGSKIELMCDDETAKIYYTLDGSNPESMGIEYKEPITINSNVQLKTVAVSTIKHNSEIKTYDINVGKKENLLIYVSPSNQHGNLGVKEVGYTNEMNEMNDLANYVIERLNQYGVRTKRNTPAAGIDVWNKESMYLGADLHIALHSNASDDHTSYGTETWINNTSSSAFSIASLIQRNLIEIYPNKDLPGYNRGVKYANGALGEVNDDWTYMGMLVEVAHHDYERDAAWIMQNKKLIGYNIADSILTYFGYID